MEKSIEQLRADADAADRFAAAAEAKRDEIIRSAPAESAGIREEAAARRELADRARELVEEAERQLAEAAKQATAEVIASDKE